MSNQSWDCDACGVHIINSPFVWEPLGLCANCFELPRAVSLLVERADGAVLGVSRKYDHTQFGLPGGKIDPGETAHEAIFRELTEETGLTMKECRYIYVGVCPGGRDGIAYLNLVYKTDEVIGTIHTDEPHVVAWVTRDKLIEGPFGKFIRRLFESDLP